VVEMQTEIQSDVAATCGFYLDLQNASSDLTPSQRGAFGSASGERCPPPLGDLLGQVLDELHGIPLRRPAGRLRYSQRLDHGGFGT